MCVWAYPPCFVVHGHRVSSSYRTSTPRWLGIGAGLVGFLAILQELQQLRPWYLCCFLVFFSRLFLLVAPVGVFQAHPQNDVHPFSNATPNSCPSQDKNIDAGPPAAAAAATVLRKRHEVAARPDVLMRYPFVDDLAATQGGGVGAVMHQATPTTPIQYLAKREIR